MTHVEQTILTDVGDTSVKYAHGGRPLVEEIKVELRIVEGPDADRSFLLPRAGAVVGTGSDAEFRLTDPSVSRRHVKLTPVPEGVHAVDLGSTNGTRYKGEKIVEATVPLDSSLIVGKTRIDVARLVDRQPLPLSRRRRFGELIGSSPPMRQVYALLERASEVDVTVLIEGETGTGKELAARAVHEHSTRSQKAFQIVDCGAVSPTLIEAELFGHVRGSFTGADRDRSGAFELAHQGTLFFDEIGELPLQLQPKLLRALETREVRRIGGSSQIPVDVRFVAATNRSLADEVKAGRFREDLYYRLNVFRVVMPPLREHREDIPVLVKHFLDALGAPHLSEEMLERMFQVDWPGNVRELRNAVHRAVVLARGDAPVPVSQVSDRPEDAPRDPNDFSVAIDATRPFKDVKADIVNNFEIAYIKAVLARTGGNVSAAARDSGIDRKHMERLIRKLGIETKPR
jgi:two-component system, NtrC family, nitrogen regulation response regulator GlnG